MDRLLVLKPDDALWKHLGLFSFPFILDRTSQIPVPWEDHSVVLLKSDYLFDLRFPVAPPERFIVYGPATAISVAFSMGAVDYLREPWDCAELCARVERLLGPTTLNLGVLSLRGRVLKGPVASVVLSSKEAILLSALFDSPSRRVSRKSLLRGLWPGLRPNSRAADALVSRLRAHLADVCYPATGPELRSVRSYGYSLEHCD